MKEYIEKEIAFERVLFFSDAIVAIAITLLALDLKLNVPEGHALTFKDLLLPWQNYLAFILSFINIAGFWRSHHDFFIFIKKMDEWMLFFNTCWLFFIVTLPFATSVLSSHFGDAPAVFLYSLNVFVLSVFQNNIWDYANNKGFMHEDKSGKNEELYKRLRLMLNLDMLNGIIAMIVSFFFPKTAFFLLFFKLPLFVIATFIVARQRRKELATSKNQKDE
jgi:uncharacterized membrane protein